MTQHNGPTFSEQWYRVAELHPRLHAHVRMLRHSYRGEIWHVLEDPVSGRQHRINPVAWSLVARLDGRHNLQKIWDLVVEELGSRAPTQPEVLALLGQLHSNELIASEASPDLSGMFKQQRKRRGQKLLAQRNPLAFKVPLGHPGAWLDRMLPLARLLFTPWAGLIWLILVMGVALLTASHSQGLAVYARLHVGSAQQLLLLWLLFPLVKVVHELAHALALRRWGGEVGEVGVTLMLLMPVPYVDASAATGFRARHRRVIVSLAGIACELLLAALAFLVWLSVADGTVRQAAFAVMLIGAVSTLAFNGNPLIRMDAYHALADWLESPGLAQRSRAYWLYLARRWLLGLRQTRPPAVGRGERRWLLGYGAASTLYQWLLAGWIVSWLLGVNLALGIFALSWFVLMMVALPAKRLWRWARTSAELSEHRSRALSVGALVAAMPVLLLLVLPLPATTRADGVVWLPEGALARARADGFVAEVLVVDGAEVEPGTPILLLDDPHLPAQADSLLARERRLRAALQLALFSQPAMAAALSEQLAELAAEQQRLDDRSAALTVRALQAGQVVLPRGEDLPGSFVARGTVVAHVLPPEGSPVRVVVAQDDVSRLARQSSPPQVRLASAPTVTRSAQLLAQTPAATRELPSPLLADRHAGRFATDPQDPKALRTLEPVFTLDLALPDGVWARPGTRAWVRFDHGLEPLGWQWARRLRQLFIGRLASGETKS